VSCPGVARRGASVSRSDDGGTDRTFARASRLRARKVFLDVYERGHRMHTAYFVLFALKGATSRSRLGITATKKFGHAVARNRIKRVIREIFRKSRETTSSPVVDLVVNVKMAAREQSYDRLEADLASRLRELHRRLGA
jgi:ribonuclease P protein component